MKVERPNRRKGTNVPCLACKTVFYRHACTPNRRYCSTGCGNDSRRRYVRESRTCSTCKGRFLFSDKPFSNSSGTYCSLACRNDGYSLKAAEIAAADGLLVDRPRWKTKRRAFVEAGNDFCTCCGVRSNLEVHHIDPYRSSRDDSWSNLATVCHRCHMRMEKWSETIASLPQHKRAIAVAIVQAHMQDTWLLHKQDAAYA